MDGLTLDQIRIFLAIVDEGSFSKAGRRLGRAQSAVTYGMQNLEAQLGIKLFDRAAYRPSLTEARRALLIRARRVAEEASGFRNAAQSLASGLEAELAIVLDPMFPMQPVVDALKALAEHFPTVPPRIYVEPLGAAAKLVLDGTGVIGLLPLVFSIAEAFRSFPLLTVDLIPVAAPGHPLGMMDEPIETLTLQRHVQLVLTDRSALATGRDQGVLSRRTWRLADLGAKQSMLRAGLGWGNMPAHLVEDDIAQGRLKVVRPVDFDSGAARIVMGGAYVADRRLGPAAQWMVGHLSASVCS